MLNSQVGVFNLNTITGAQSVTGLGFQPKLMLFVTNPLSVDSSPTAEHHLSFGASDGTNQFAHANNARDGFATMASAKYHRTDRIAWVATGGGLTTPDYEASLTSFDVDGFTINVDDAPPSGYRVGYYALGGSDIANVKVGNFQVPASTGSQAITGLGFQPDIILFSAIGSATAPPSGSTIMNYMFGAGSNSQARCMSQYGNSSGIIASCAKLYSDIYPIICLATASTYRYYATITSFDVDGFTLNWGAVTANQYVQYIAIKGAGGFQQEIGDFAIPTTTGSHAITGMSIDPATLLFFGASKQSFSGFAGSNDTNFGFVSNDLSRFSSYGAFLSGFSPQVSNKAQTASKAYRGYTNANPPVLEDSFDVTSFDTAGFTINADTVKGISPNIVLYVALGGATSPPSSVSDNFGYMI